MKKHLFLLLIGIFISAILFGQDNFKSGYIITNDSDTINGLIDFRTSKMNQERCRLKISDKSEVKEYYPEGIIGYRFTDEGNYYVSHEIEIDGEKRTVFLEYLVKGMMNLYYYEDKQKYFFFEDGDGKTSMITQDLEKLIDSRYISKDTRYKGKLTYMFNDYDPIVRASQKAEFNQKSMIGIAKMYHEEVCTTGDDCVVFENKNPDDSSFKLKFSVYGGLQFFSYVFEESNKFFHATSIAPAIGGQMNVFNPRWSKSFSFQIDISFSRFEKNNSIIDVPKDRKKFSYSYEGYAFSPKLGIKYTYSKYRFRPVVEGGLAFLFMFGESCNKKTIYYHTPSGGDDGQKYKMHPHFIGYYAGLGLDYNLREEQNIFIRFSFEDYWRMIIKDESNVGDYVRIPQIKVGYTF